MRTDAFAGAEVSLGESHSPPEYDPEVAQIAAKHMRYAFRRVRFRVLVRTTCSVLSEPFAAFLVADFRETRANLRRSLREVSRRRRANPNHFFVWDSRCVIISNGFALIAVRDSRESATKRHRAFGPRENPESRETF